MSTERVEVWCKPANGGRHNIATVVSDVANGFPYFTIKFKSETTTVTKTGDFQSFASETNAALVDNELTTYPAYCPGCKAPIQLSSRKLWSHVEESLREQRVVEMNVSPDTAIEADKLWAMAHEQNDWKVSDECADGGLPPHRIHPDAKNRLRNDPRDKTR